MRIDEARFLQDLEALGRFGLGPGGGLDRLAYSSADLEARAWVEARMRELGMAVRRDAAGNTIASYPGSVPDLPPIALGSHTDTVPNGGRFDGALGVMAALACVRAVGQAEAPLRHPVEVINFAAEEGTMSGVTFGSRAMAGALEPEALDQAAYDGRPVREHLRTAGLDPEAIGEARRERGCLAAYLELHIEQGGVLEREGLSIGVVEGIVGIRRFRVLFEGLANHAGTTPMDTRRDALVMAAPFVLAVREIALEHGVVGTVGALEVEPGAPNVIPGRAQLVVEIRSLSEATLDRVQSNLARRAEAGGGVFERVSGEAPVAADAQLVRLLEAACSRLGLSFRRMASGAGHDAMAMASLAPMAMLFVPSRAGISHSPEEFTDPGHCAAGAQVLLAGLLELDSVSAAE